MVDAPQAASGPTLTATRSSHAFGKVPALGDVSFALQQGVTGLVGVNGAGKSTLLTAMSGAARPDTGSIMIEGADLYGSTRKEALCKVAFMPQLPSFPKNLTAIEVVTYLAWMRGVAPTRARSNAFDALTAVGLGHRARDRLGALSGGMQRRVALAQAIASEANVLLLDEPSTGLDPQQRRAMVELLKELSGTVVISSHVMEDIAELCHRVLILDQGKMRFDNSIDALAELAPLGTPEPRRLEAGFLSVCVGAGYR